jgi:hypothetical protein
LAKLKKLKKVEETEDCGHRKEVPIEDETKSNDGG